MQMEMKKCGLWELANKAECLVELQEMLIESLQALQNLNMQGCHT
jgi:hypothetical protein